MGSVLPPAVSKPVCVVNQGGTVGRRVLVAIGIAHDVAPLLSAVASEAVHAPQDALENRLARILPFLDAYLELARAQLANHCAWTKALFKLDYVICSVMHSVAKDGFCKPPEGEAGAGEIAVIENGAAQIRAGEVRLIEPGKLKVGARQVRRRKACDRCCCKSETGAA